MWAILRTVLAFYLDTLRCWAGNAMLTDELLNWLGPLVSPWIATILDWISALPNWMKDSKAIEIGLLVVIGVQLSRVVRQLHRQRTLTGARLSRVVRQLHRQRTELDHTLQRQRTELDHTVDRFDDRLLSLRKMLQALRDETETASEPDAVADEGREYWEKVRSLWATTRNRIELAIDRISDSLVRRKYANMDRYTYRDIIFALNGDKIFGNLVAAQLVQMSGTFMKLRRHPRSTTKQDVERFEVLYRAVSSSLPAEGSPVPQSAGEEAAQPPVSPMPELPLEISGVTVSTTPGKATNGHAPPPL